LATWRTANLPQRLDVLRAEGAVARRLRPLRPVDLACAQALDQGNLGPPRQQRREVEFLEHHVLVRDAAAPEPRQPAGPASVSSYARGSRYPMTASRPASYSARNSCHARCVADPGGHAEEHGVVSAAGMLAHTA
jgi:hypothetical protein